MDDASIERMATRIAGGTAPESDPLFELERLIAECRGGMASVVAGVSEGRLSEESMSRLWRSLNDRARGACESLRSCKSEIEAVLPRTKPGWEPAPVESAPR
jgi:hypothetical protein